MKTSLKNSLTGISLVGLSLFSCHKSGSGDEDQTPPAPESYCNIVATDALGRKLPTHEEVGKFRTTRYVGLFYWTWRLTADQPPYNVSEILAAHPEAIDDYYHPAWPSNGGSYYWGEPLFDYYLTPDRWVLRKHAELLALAGVDVVIFDCSNGNFTWQDGYMELCSVFAEARAAGVKTPQIAFLMSFGVNTGGIEATEEVYKRLYKAGLYSDLWFQWKGSPLIMAYPEGQPEEIQNYFTFRPGQAAYSIGPERTDHWGWLEIYPQHGFASRNTGFEQVAVGVAQNWSTERGTTAMNAPNVFGRSYTGRSGLVSGEGAVNWGYNFQEQWDRALELKPQFVFVTGWNEWTAGRQESWGGQYNAFADQFSQERSRDIEPMKGGHADNYYYQLAINIRRFKGISPPEPPSMQQTIAIDGSFDEWKDVLPAFDTPSGNTMHRNHAGWQGVHYTNTTGRNDFVCAKVARDADNLYFYIETAEAITAATDKNWMMLFIDSDRDKATGWEGYDYVVNRTPPGAKAVIERSTTGGWNWQACGEIDFRVSGKQMEIKIPRAMLAMTGQLDFEFKWSDNLQQEGDVMDFYLSGDAAPIARYNFLYKE
jgi:hypothetical protein